MAGKPISNKQNTSSGNNNLANFDSNQRQSLDSNINSFKAATCLSKCLKHNSEANEHCCSWFQQLKVAKPNSSTKKDKPMQHNTTDYCHNNSSIKCSSSSTNDRTLTTYNNNKHNNYKQPRPLTLSLAVLIMSLSIFLMQMPTYAYGRYIYKESPLAPSASLSLASEKTDMSTETHEKPSKLILSLLEDTEDENVVPSSGSAALDSLTSLDVLRHAERTREYQKERRMRLRKRHLSDYIITNYLHEDANNLEWKNPCNVDHVQTNIETQRVNSKQAYHYLKKFEHDLYIEYDFVNATATKININDIADWSKHDEVYKFLPKLMGSGSIALRRWYRNMQVYVASFGYLARTQYKFDKNKQIFDDDISQELNKLLISARFVLCELETTINSSASNNNFKQPKTISRRAMNSRLNFVTKHQLAGMGSGAVLAANTVDLKFAKYSYFQYLKDMHKFLNLKLQQKGKKYGYVDNNNSNNNDDVNVLSVGDDVSSRDFSSIFKSDTSLSLGESTELLLKTTKKPHSDHKRRQHKKKIA